jgi:hypothetical protein
LFASIRNRWPKSGSFNSLLILFVLLIAISVYRWILLSGQAAPPGSDGGNWLAFSSELFGAKVRAADAAYPPLFPLLLRFTLLFFSPLTTMLVTRHTRTQVNFTALPMVRTPIVYPGLQVGHFAPWILHSSEHFSYRPLTFHSHFPRSTSGSLSSPSSLCISSPSHHSRNASLTLHEYRVPTECDL